MKTINEMIEKGIGIMEDAIENADDCCPSKAELKQAMIYYLLALGLIEKHYECGGTGWRSFQGIVEEDSHPCTCTRGYVPVRDKLVEASTKFTEWFFNESDMDVEVYPFADDIEQALANEGKG